jgi:hypothetical protein
MATDGEQKVKLQSSDNVVMETGMSLHLTYYAFTY